MGNAKKIQLAVLCLIVFYTICPFSGAIAQDPPVAIEVRHVGEMRKVQRDGDLRGTIDLKSLSKTNHLYALGPIEGLKGEVTIWDGKPSLSKVVDGKMATTDQFAGKACFLVYAQVPSWREIDVPPEVQTEKQLESFIGKAAPGLGLNSKRPFPFAVKGSPDKVAFHVVNKTDDTPHTREKHDQIKVHFAVEKVPVRVIGFYSDQHHGIFTHHDSNIHMHVITEDEKQSGHVESLKLGKGCKLLLPKN